MNGGQPLLDSQQPRLARTVGIGEHVLVNSGESVSGQDSAIRLDGAKHDTTA